MRPHFDTAAEHPDQSGVLPQMIATLACYERMFGPVSMQTLTLAVLVGQNLVESGETELARRLLERAARDVVRAGGPTHEVRLSALSSLRDLYLKREDLTAAIRVQTELVSCRMAQAGEHESETVEAKSRLASLLMQSTAAPGA